MWKTSGAGGTVENESTWDRQKYKKDLIGKDQHQWKGMFVCHHTKKQDK